MLGEHNGEGWRAGLGRAPLSRPAGPKPLSGVRVVDFTNAVAGPIASFILGDLGADVIKVEGPRGRPLDAKGTAPLVEGGVDEPWNRMMIYNELNHGKLGVSLDVTVRRGRELACGWSRTRMWSSRTSRRGRSTTCG
jgi:crotonobetainyl-CoA:carnitine CoA-transferase CaiB-like acyl-CoA transferase